MSDDSGHETEDEGADSVASAGPPDEGAAGRRRAVRFLVIFGVSYGLFELFYHGLVLDSSAFGSYLGATASAAAGLLRLFGQDVVALGERVSGEGFAVAVRSGCDGLEPMALLVLGVLAFPAAWKQKLVGVAGGLGLLLFLNVSRVATLHQIGVRGSLETFESAHLEIWPTILIICAVGAWIGWMTWVQRRPGPAPEAAAADE